jgi:large subunit ribosomal protein L32e
MARRKFLRTDWKFHSKLGKGRKNKQKYRRPRGRHNKLREKVRGNPRKVSIGFKKTVIPENIRIIKNMQDLKMVQKGEKVLVSGKAGMKNRIKIAQEAKIRGIRIDNLHVHKFLERIEKKKQEAQAKQPEAKK